MQESRDLSSENRFFEGQLLRVKAELDSQRDKHFFSFSQNNQALKEELESLKGVQDRVQAANAKVVEQKKLLERLPTAEKEREMARKAASEAEELCHEHGGRIPEGSRPHCCLSH